MIPKIIHYCWFSGEPFSELQQKCFDSWQRKLPDYQFVKWDKERASVIQSRFYHKMLRQKRWAYASDYVRLYALYHHGGIYLDMDIEVLKPLDDLLSDRVMIGLSDTKRGKKNIGCHLMGAEAGHPFIKKNLSFYDTSFRLKISAPPSMPIIVTKIAQTFNYRSSQKAGYLDEGIKLHPVYYFSPLPFAKPRKEFKKEDASDSYAIHWWAHGWSLSRKTLRDKIRYTPWLFLGFWGWKSAIKNLFK